MTYVEMLDKADRVRNLMVDRARRIALQAGLDPSCPFHHAHNAACAADAGRPWRGVDYRLVRKIQWLELRSYEPHRLVSRWCGKNHARRIAS